MKTLEERVEELEVQVAAIRAAQAAGSVPDVADDEDLDGPHGDPVVKKCPQRWRGPNYEGRRYSQTEPAFLDCLASFLVWCSEKDDAAGKARFATYGRRDAARARGWAARMRRGWRKPIERRPYAEEG